MSQIGPIELDLVIDLASDTKGGFHPPTPGMVTSLRTALTAVKITLSLVTKKPGQEGIELGCSGHIRASTHARGTTTATYPALGPSSCLTVLDQDFIAYSTTRGITSTIHNQGCQGIPTPHQPLNHKRNPQSHPHVLTYKP